MSFMTIKQTAKLWNLSESRISALCKNGRIKGAVKSKAVWRIPEDAEKPCDLRKKEHICAAPNSNTVDIKPIYDLITPAKKDEIRIDPFADKNKISSIANNPNKEFEPDKKLIDKLKNLPDDFWDFKDEDTQDLTHGLHSYPATMIYPISRNIIKIMKSIVPIETVLDPFAGSGTVLVESVLAGIKNIYGNDLNPLSNLLTLVKTRPLNPEKLSEVYDRLIFGVNVEYLKYANIIKDINAYFTEKMGVDLTAKDGWGANAVEYLEEFYKSKNINLTAPNFKNIGYWFKPSVIMELQIIKNAIKKIEDVNIQKFFWVVFSETIRLTSNRRNGEFKMFRMEARKVASFNPDVRKEFCKLAERNLVKMRAFSERLRNRETNSNITVLSENSMELSGVPDNSIDIVITSPPYGDSKTTVAYGEFSRLSLQWTELYGITDKDIMSIDKNLMGGNTKYRKGFKCELKSDTLKTALAKIKELSAERAGDVFSFYKDLDAVMKTVASKTKINGYQFWVVGNRTVKNENLETDVIITELAEQYGLRHVRTIDRKISNKVMPSKNSPSNKPGDKVTTMVNEHIVILRRTV